MLFLCWPSLSRGSSRFLFSIGEALNFWLTCWKSSSLILLEPIWANFPRGVPLDEWRLASRAIAEYLPSTDLLDLPLVGLCLRALFGGSPDLWEAPVASKRDCLAYSSGCCILWLSRLPIKLSRPLRTGSSSTNSVSAGLGLSFREAGLKFCPLAWAFCCWSKRLFVFSVALAIN